MARARNLRISRKSQSKVEQGSLDGDNGQIGHNSTTESSQDQRSNLESSPNTEHQNGGRTYECVVQDGKRTRGKTVLGDIWNLPPGHRVVVEINKSSQPIGDEGGVLGHYCGTIARHGDLCSLSYTRWDYLKKGNKGNNQTLILNEVKEVISLKNDYD
ncbi:uncharacterized protein LOC141639067 isoform X2 [Silene latifolia]|uniref:uncharacterized protein LOC141639067 isoform X2 n=1 Tax=Silene latifolia TaxID=37657 RepID=UPI003D775930